MVMCPYTRFCSCSRRGNIDLSGIRTFPIRYRWRVQFRAEAFNLLNHPQFGAPNTAEPPDADARVPWRRRTVELLTCEQPGRAKRVEVSVWKRIFHRRALGDPPRTVRASDFRLCMQPGLYSGAAQQMAADHRRGADACSQGDHHEVIGLLRVSRITLAQKGRPGIGFDSD